MSLQTSQRQAATKVACLCQSVGLPEYWAVGMLVNAYWESALDPTRVGDNGHARGLWQCHDRYVGRGLTPEQCHDVVTSTLRMIVEAQMVMLRKPSWAVLHPLTEARGVCHWFALFVEKPFVGERRLREAKERWERLEWVHLEVASIVREAYKLMGA